MIKTTGLAATLALAAPHLNLQAHFTPFQAGGGSWHMAAPAVGNIDGDSDLEIVLASRDLSSVWTVDAYDYTGARIAGFPYIAGNDPVNASPSLKDLDGDGKNEIIFTEGASVVALRGNGTVLWRHSVSPLNYLPDSGFHALTNGFYLSGIPLQQATLPLTAAFWVPSKPKTRSIPLEGVCAGSNVPMTISSCPSPSTSPTTGGVGTREPKVLGHPARGASFTPSHERKVIVCE